MGSPFYRPTLDFESRKSIEEDIIDSLKKSNVDMIGICGMGGVGKTTMARRIVERVTEENLFDEFVMVTVSQTMDVAKIQNEIAEGLDLKFDVESVSARARKLHTRLMDPKRKIIIFDDVWKSFRFEDLGIPVERNFGRFKVVLTSRSRDTCNTIKNKVVFDLKILEEEEAWILFKEKAGKCVEDSALHSVAKKVAKECKGLPIALITVGIALRDKSSIYKWKDSLLQLRRSNPTDFPEVLTDVYNPLKLSYDCLDNDREKYLFLLCCLFPEDHKIPVEQLTWCSMGLRLFDDITNIEEIRNRTHNLVEKLKSRSLLIAVEDHFLFGHGDKPRVKMHDVVRDVAIYIGSRKNHGFLKSLQSSSIENPCDVNCNWMSVDISNEQMEVPVLSRFPKLRLLMLLQLRYNVFYDISHISFEGMEDLNVLSISIRSLPPTLGSLENLQTLSLFRCEIENISVIGKLTSLKILSCRHCPNITELPAEIGRLKDLRILELNGCSKLQRIPFGIISSLSLLEELKILTSFSEWGNALLTELEALRNLTCLEIEISDCTLLAQAIRLPQKLVRYRIKCTKAAAIEYAYTVDDVYEKAMILNLPGAVANWIQLLARNAEYLSLQGDGSDNINLAEMENLRNLRLSNCSMVKKLVDTSYLIQNVSLCNLKFIFIFQCSNLKHVFSVSVATTRLIQLEMLSIEDCESMEQVFWNEIKDNNTDGCIEFPKLKKLTLCNLPNLTAFCQGLENITIKFPNLTEMWIVDLPKLNSIFPVDSKDCLQLEFLAIGNCESMEQVFWNEIKDNNTYGFIEFSKLKKLTLWNLPNLTAFCQRLENIIIKFPNLTDMKIIGFSKVKCICCHHDLRHPVCIPEVESPNNIFNNLKILHISFMNGIRRLMSTSLAKILVSLRKLTIHDCKDMVEVIEMDDDNDKQIVDIICSFPYLRQLNLWNLNKLIRFWQWNHTLELPLLEDMKINNCPAMETFTLGSINTPKLRRISVNFKNIEVHKNMNDVIRNIWTEGQKSRVNRSKARVSTLTAAALYTLSLSGTEEPEGIINIVR